MDEINKKLDKIVEKQSEMNATLAVNTASLVDHMQRTRNLEDRVDDTESWIDSVKGAHKLLVLIALVGGIAATLIKIT